MDSSYNNMKRAVEFRSLSREQREQQNAASNKSRILNILSKSLMTVAIGAIQSIEDNYGELWNHGKPYSELNENQKLEYHRWQDVRTSILDNLNKRIRKIETELDKYTLNYVGYNYKFDITQGD